MRILLITLGSLIVSFCLFMIIKMWGQSILYIDYKHPIYQTENPTSPLIFIHPSFDKTKDFLESKENLYLDVATTLDEKLVVTEFKKEHVNDVRLKMYDDVKDRVILLENYSEQLKNRKVIFNIVENAIAGHEIFIDDLKKIGFYEGDRMIVVSPYDTLAKSIKEKQPTYIFGASQPEILRIKAMESLYLIEAATYRADVVIHPLKFYNQTFFTETLLTDLKHRFKRFIVGPIAEENLNEAVQLKPFAIIINK